LKKNNVTMTTTRDKGANSEEIAVQYLVKNGYEILDRNCTIITMNWILLPGKII